MNSVFLVCQDVDLGYHVYAVCTSKAMADKYMDDHLELRIDQWETIQRDRAMQYHKKGIEFFNQTKPQREDYGFYVEERLLNEPANLGYFDSITFNEVIDKEGV